MFTKFIMWLRVKVIGLKRSLRRWRCRRDYNQLSENDKVIVDFFEQNPDQKIKRGEL